MQDKRVELLAPAGNPEGFYGAIHAGADAVYLGGSKFGARAYADNFTTEELIECIRYAHLWNRKVYLTVNTLVKQTEFQDIYEYLLPFYQAGLDGVIVQDIGVLAYLREQFPEIEIHVSTQMTLTGMYGAAMLRDMGACRIVPARELSLKEIRRIKKETGLSIETFIHGAMCYSYSGQCLFSSILGGRSGNRGRCAQPCRLPYRVQTQQGETGECYPLSLKDMCTIEHIPDLIRSGIDSFKIEGRMKKPEYTAGVTAIYRKYIDKYYENEGKDAVHIQPEDLKALSCLYIRSERQDGYYYKQNGKDMVTLASPAYSGSDEALLMQIRQRYIEHKPKKAIAVYADFQTGKRASVTFVMGDISVKAEGNPVETASKQPISKENIAKQLSKLGDSCFTAEKIEIQVSDDAFYPLREMNELRRMAVNQLENEILNRNGFPISRNCLGKSDKEYMEKSTIVSQHCGKMHISLRSLEQLKVVSAMCSLHNEFSISRVYLDCDLLAEDAETIISLCTEMASKCELIIALPYIIREKDYFFLENTVFGTLAEYANVFSGVLVRSVEGMGMLKAKGYTGEVYADAGFYIWNQRTLQEWSDSINGFCIPFELKGAEQRKLLGSLPCEKVVYGRIPMMITANCIAKTTSQCRNGSGKSLLNLTDRYHKTFPVELNCIRCMNIIYNSVPLSLHGELSKWKHLVDFRIDLSVENEEETRAIITFFTDDTITKPPYKDYTTGHEKRGVE